MKIPEKVFKLLNHLQRILVQESEPILGFSYNKWRKVKSKDSSTKCSLTNMIDGDTIRKLQDLTNSQLEILISKIPEQPRPNVQEVIYLIDLIERLIF